MKSMRAGIVALVAVIVIMIAASAIQEVRAAEDPAIEHNGGSLVLSAFLIVAAVVASPLTMGGSFVATSIAWPAVIGAGAAAFSTLPSSSDKAGRS